MTLCHSHAALLAIVGSVTTATAVPLCHADPVLPSLFTDHMVLQRDRPLRIWGTADAGEPIRVSINGQVVQAKTGADGRWTAFLAPMAAGGPFTLTVAGKKLLSVHDVLVGEVWIASGQSNMNYALSGAEGGANEVKEADRPLIRLFKVPQRSSLHPQQEVSSAWTLCTPETAANFSAVAYYFARDLALSLHVPVGIVQSSWSGSTAEEWTDTASLASKPKLMPLLEAWQNAPCAVRTFASDGGTFDLRLDDFEVLATDHKSPVSLANFDDAEAMTAGSGYWQAANSGVLELTHPGHGNSAYAARFTGRTELSSLPSLSTTFRRTHLGDSGSRGLEGFTAIRFFAQGRGCYQLRLAMPRIVDGDNYSSKTICANEEWEPITIPFADLSQAGWGVKHLLNLAEVTGISIDMTGGIEGQGQRPPSGLYNGMIYPLSQYPIRGAIWYQGEGNSSRASEYRTLLPTMIAGWRKAWDQGDFPFLIVQLPNFGERQLYSAASGWAELREAQLLTATTVPSVGMAVTIDLGEATNLHPPRKAEVAERLSRLALNKVYGFPIESSGPKLVEYEVRDDHIRLEFAHASGLRAQGSGELKGLMIAGADHNFVPALATIVGSTIIASSRQVKRPLAVRYAWAGNPICNLVNSVGLPASPFRTDDW